MNFTQEEAYNEIIGKLKQKEANPLVNERSIKAMIERDFSLLKDSEIDLEAYAISAASMAKEVDGNIRNVNKTTIEAATEAIKTKAIEDYLRANPPAIKKEEVIDDSILKSFEERMAALENENTNYKKERIVASKRSELVSKFKTKGVSDEDFISNMLEISPISEDTDVDAYIEKGVKFYNKSISSVPQSSGAETTGSGTAGKNSFFDAVGKLE